MKILLALALYLSLHAEIQLAPDGTYVDGTPQLTPDGEYVGSGDIVLTPDGDYMTIQPEREEYNYPTYNNFPGEEPCDDPDY